MSLRENGKTSYNHYILLSRINISIMSLRENGKTSYNHYILLSRINISIMSLREEDNILLSPVQKLK
jgi:hypothetical protein